MDPSSTGLGKDQLFFNLLDCSDIGLKDKQRSELRAQHSNEEGKINYLKCIQSLENSLSPQRKVNTFAPSSLSPKSPNNVDLGPS